MNKLDYPYAARRVLNAINQMFAIYFWKTALQPKIEKDPDLQLPLVALENATVESSLIAIRAFDDFIQSKRRNTDDLVASDFNLLTITGRGIGNLEKKKINKHIAHLTQIDLTFVYQSFTYRKSLAALIPAAIEFCDYLTIELSFDSILVCHSKDTKEICESIRKAYVDN